MTVLTLVVVLVSMIQNPRRVVEKFRLRVIFRVVILTFLLLTPFLMTRGRFRVGLMGPVFLVVLQKWWRREVIGEN